METTSVKCSILGLYRDTGKCWRLRPDAPAQNDVCNRNYIGANHYISRMRLKY